MGDQSSTKASPKDFDSHGQTSGRAGHNAGGKPSATVGHDGVSNVLGRKRVEMLGGGHPLALPLGAALIVSWLAAYPAVAWAAPPSPPPKYDYPVLREFFPWGVYAPQLDFGCEPWRQKDLKCTDAEALERFYRNYVLHDFNLFGLNLGHDQATFGRYLRLAERYGGKLEAHLNVGNLSARYTGKADPGVRWPLETVVERWTQFVEPFKADPHVFSWRIYDEITCHRDYEQEYVYALKQKIHDIDKLHPVSFFEQGSPSKVTPNLELGMGECYVHYFTATKGRDMSGVEDFLKKEWKSFQEQTMRLCILWAAAHGGYEPTVADVRGQAYAMLANGWNGIAFYVGNERLPPWISWEPADPVAKKDLFRSKDVTLCLGFEQVNPLLAEVSALGAKIIPLGHLLLQGAWQPEPGFAASGDLARLERGYTVPETGHWRVEKQDSPALRVGHWRHADGDVLIVYNRDFDVPHRGVLDLSGKLPEQRVYDLFTMAEVNLEQGGVACELAPGDGRFFLVATETGFARQRAEICRRRYEHEANKFDIVLRRAAGTKMLDLAETEANVSAAKKLHAGQDHEAAWRRFEEARQSFQAAVGRVPAFQEIEDCRMQANDSLYRIHRWLADRLLLLVPEPIMQNGATIQQPIGSDRPALDAILRGVRDAAADYFPLTRGFECGEQTNVAPFKGMAAALRKAEDRLSDYRAEADTSHPERVAFLEVGGGDATGAWPLLQLLLPLSSRVRLSATGDFEDEKGNPCKLEDFDVVWFDYSLPVGKAFIDKGRRIPAPEPLVSQKVLDAFRKFLRSGKGLLLSGLAPAYVVPLGLETVEPDTVEIKEVRFCFEGGRAYTSNQYVGLKPLSEYREHPLFRGLSGSEYFLRSDSVDAPVTRASWTYPNIPRQGNVLGGMTTSLVPPPDKMRLDLVEFSADGNGRVIAVGLPKFHFRQDVKRTDPRQISNYRQLMSFMRNTFTYLGDTKRPAFAYKPLSGPFYHTDFARFESNPDLQVKVSSTRSDGVRKGPLTGDDVDPLAPFHVKAGYFYKWDSVETPAWVEIDFGKKIEVGKIHLANHWISHTAWTIQRFRIQVWDDARKEFVDTSPAISFQAEDKDASFRGITLTFEPLEIGNGPARNPSPLAARRLRIADLDGVEYAQPANKGVSISKISMYGRPAAEGQ